MNNIKQFEPLFGGWYVEEVLGKGSFGTVYKIHRDDFGVREYSAVKHFSIPSSEEEVSALRSEGYNDKSISDYYGSLINDITAENRLMQRLKGTPNIVSIEESAVLPKNSGTGYDVFIRMELLTSLSKAIQHKALTREDVIRLGVDLCCALEVCESEEIIHRDIKPDNIFVDAYGSYKLGDFGIARQLDRTSAFMSKKGTYNYMAPEVYKGESYGTSCDIYSLGLVMYRLMNRKRMPFMPLPPTQIFPADAEKALMRRIKGEPLPAPCDADPQLSAVILKACSFSQRGRYHSATEMKLDLKRLLKGAPVQAAAPTAANGGYRQPAQPAQPGVQYRQPAQPGVQYRQPAQPGAQYRQPAQPGVQYRQPAQPAQPGVQYRQPAQPGVQYRQPVRPAAPRGNVTNGPEALPAFVPPKKKSHAGVIILITLLIAAAIAGLVILSLKSCLSGGSSGGNGSDVDRSSWETVLDSAFSKAVKKRSNEVIKYVLPERIDELQRSSGMSRDKLESLMDSTIKGMNITGYRITGSDLLADSSINNIQNEYDVRVEEGRKAYVDYDAAGYNGNTFHASCYVIIIKVKGSWYLLDSDIFSYQG